MATLGTFVVGQVLTAAELNAIGTWTTFTPSWTNFTKGTATESFRYTEINKLMVVNGTVTLSGSTMGTAPRFTIPNSRTAIGDSYGWCQVKDSGTANYYGMCYATGTSIFFAMANVGATYVTLTDITATVPMTWANSDAIAFTVVFPIS